MQVCETLLTHHDQQQKAIKKNRTKVKEWEGALEIFLKVVQGSVQGKNMAWRARKAWGGKFNLC